MRIDGIEVNKKTNTRNLGHRIWVVLTYSDEEV